MMSGGAGAPSAAQASRIRGAHALGRQGLSSEGEAIPVDPCRGQQSGARRHAALGGGLRATDACELGGGLDPAAGGEVRGIDTQDDAVGAQPVGDRDG